MTVHAAPFSLLHWDDLDDVIESEELPDLNTQQDAEGLDVLRVSWFSQFKFGQYDWEDPEFVKNNTGPKAFRAILLTQGYFMIVSPHDYKRMTQYPDGSHKKWYASVRKDPRPGGAIFGIYGMRKGRRDEPGCVLAHRELLDCLFDPGEVDHKNGWGLDNRRGTPEHPVNLQYVSHSENIHNALRSRATGLVLPRGVEIRRKNKQGKPLYGGKWCRRAGNKVKTTRSGRVWLSPIPAARWYQSQMKRLHQRRTEWAHNPESVNYPEFPPFVPGLVPF